MSSKIPPLLQPYLALPSESSLILLTGVLGASTNWLVLRYLCSFLLGDATRDSQGEKKNEGGDVGVVLLSFMRDWAFWREGGSKLALDLDSLAKMGRFSFVDGLTGLYAPDGGGSVQLPRGRRILRSDRLEDVEGGIKAALGDLRTGRNVLVVDGVDELLAASTSASSSAEGTSALAVENTLLSVREHFHASILTLAGDSPLLHAQSTTLERAHASLAVSQAHVADGVVSLRLLDTGVARDVSGVMRITTTPTTTTGGTNTEGTSTSARGMDGGGVEYLYHVSGDGVRVFERGA